MSIYDDFGFNYGTTTSSDLGLFNIIAIVFIFFFVFSVIYSIFMVVVNWKIFKKAGRKGWEVIIPFYGLWVFFEIVGLPGWLIFIPFVNGVLGIYAFFKLASCFGKSNLFGVGLVLLPYIFLPILAFSKDSLYIGPDGNVNTEFHSNNQYQQPTQQSIVPPVSNQAEINQANAAGTEFNSNPSVEKVCSKCGTKAQSDVIACFMCGQSI